ncbi:23S rRNA pseudouridine(1911/1915/1917) synthase RluD [Halochromatium roseum]|uniref:23S rRNA pseudouridine(1911/1915/1917) synthase RluD n=1 Tax=Halochromatium roseum TaxID=391920 RepID=UPI001913379A|nr:23S rRNA pseudouridine(1911/1915/1917) synthase [Halochromatium roseum]
MQQTRLEEAETQQLRLQPEHAGRRLDQVLAELLPAFSRSRLQAWIEQGRVLLDGHRSRPKERVRGAEQVLVQPLLERVGDCLPQPIPLHIEFEDEHLLVVNKPPGLVVHPAAGHPDGTLQNALLHHAPGLAELPRCGIVHRLDKDTTGLMVVARSLLAHRSLVDQLKARSVKRDYRALVVGAPNLNGRVEAPIGRHPTRRTAMAVVAGGRPAVSDYRVLVRYRRHSLVAVQLQTGRTHQIRVHMAHLGFPLIGDPVYGTRSRAVADAIRPELAAALGAFPRQALHAIGLGLIHPASGEPMHWQIPMAADLAALCALLQQDADGEAR